MIKIEDGHLDPAEKLRIQGIYFITGEIEQGDLLNIQQDLLIKHLDPEWKDDVQIYINSSGGDIMEGWALIDMMRFVRMHVRTIGIGTCESLAARILSAGTRGKRLATPNTTIMLHDGWTEDFLQGNTHQVVAQQKWIEDEYTRNIKYWIENSRYKTQEQIEQYLITKVDKYFNVDEAIKHGIIDGIVGQSINIKKKGKR